MCKGVPTASAYCARYSFSGSTGVSAGMFVKLMFKRVFVLGVLFLGLKVMVKPFTNSGSEQKVSMICLF